MRFLESHPSGCDCGPPIQEVIRGATVVVGVESCPECLAWERLRRFGQLELDIGGGVGDPSEEDDIDDTAQPSEILTAIRAVDPSF